MFPVEPVIGRNTIKCNDPSVAGMGESDARVERMRRNNRLKMVQGELAREQQMQESVVAAESKRRAAEREAAIAFELERQKASQLKEQKTVQRVREESDEIRTLEQKLQAAYVNKVRAEQMTDAKRLAEEAKRLKAADLEAAEQKRIEDQQLKAAEAAGRMEKVQIAKQQLEEQKAMKDQEKLEAYKQFLREKNEIDGLVDRVRGEEQAERDARMAQQRQAQGFIASFKEEQNDIRLREAERQREEDRKIVEYMKLQGARQEGERRKAQEKLKEQERLLKIQTEAITRERKDKEDRERMLNEYYEEQRAEAARLDEESRHDRQRQIRLELKQYNEMQARIIQARRDKEKEEEGQLRRELLSQFAEAERMEKQSAIERQRSKAQHAREVEALIEQKRMLREAERQRELLENKISEDAADQKADIIKQERLRLLREHGLALIPYLPAGTILPGDLEALGLSKQEIAHLERQIKESSRASSAPTSFR